jgi:hypothetical protein
LRREAACRRKSLQSPDAVAAQQLAPRSRVGTAVFHLRESRLAPRFGAAEPGQQFQTNRFSNRTRRRPKVLWRFSEGHFEMVFEIITTAILIQCANMLLRLIERQRDVLNYVSKADPHRFV